MGSKEEFGLKPGAASAFVLLPAAVLSLSLLLIPAAPALAEDPRQAVQSAVNGDDIQRDRPQDAADQGAVRDRIQQSETPDIQNDKPKQKPLPTLPAPVIPMVIALWWLPYAILAVIIAGVLFLAVRYIRSRYGLNAADRDQPAAQPGTSTYALGTDEAERDHTFDEVDALAAQGAFSEAIHRLLLLVQERLRSRIEHGFQTSLTSREILRRAKLPGEAKTAFGSLVAAVEITLFGQQAANLATYQLCRENSRRVLAAAA